jgi:hypothetical protein
MTRFSRLDLMGVIATVLVAAGAQAQTFTTAAEVKPILTATKPNWIAVREWDGQDLVYFTNLLAWRCGVASVSYAVNGGEKTLLPMEPCHEDAAQPNALLTDTIQPYITLPLGSVETVTVFVTYDDDTPDQADYTRKAVLMP